MRAGVTFACILRWLGRARTLTKKPVKLVPWYHAGLTSLPSICNSTMGISDSSCSISLSHSGVCGFVKWLQALHKIPLHFPHDRKCTGFVAHIFFYFSALYSVYSTSNRMKTVRFKDTQRDAACSEKQSLLNCLNAWCTCTQNNTRVPILFLP